MPQIDPEAAAPSFTDRLKKILASIQQGTQDIVSGRPEPTTLPPSAMDTASAGIEPNAHPQGFVQQLAEFARKRGSNSLAQRQATASAEDRNLDRDYKAAQMKKMQESESVQPKVMNREIVRDGKRIVEYFYEDDPGKVIVEKEIGTVDKKKGYRDVVRDGKKIREYFDENDPSVATSSSELGLEEKPDTGPNSAMDLFLRDNPGATYDDWKKSSDTPTAPRNIDPLSPEGIKARLSIPTADARNRATALGKIDPVLKSINELSEKINTGSGLVAKAAGEVAKAQALVNYNDDVAEYNAIIAGFTPLVARAVGHSGVLTQQDVDSVKELFPKPGDSKTLRDRKTARVRFILSNGAPAAGVAPSGPTERKTATNKTTGERMESLDGGKTWHKIP